MREGVQMTLCEDEPGTIVRNDDPMKCPDCGKLLGGPAHQFVNRSIATQVHATHCPYCEADFEMVRISASEILVRVE